MSNDPLDIPRFLKRAENPKSPTGPPRMTEPKWIMPPAALGAVARAVRAGYDTMQKLRKRTRGRYTDRQIRQALQALIRSGDVARRGRRYLSQRATTKT